MEDYWGPPSFAWQDTGLFIAQNVGQFYIGAVPLLLIAGGAVGGGSGRREIRFFTVAAVVLLVYALGWYTPVFRLMYELLPGVDLYRRPADAVFLIGALGAMLAGYATHRPVHPSRWFSSRAPATRSPSASACRFGASSLRFSPGWRSTGCRGCGIRSAWPPSAFGSAAAIAGLRRGVNRHRGPALRCILSRP